MIVVTVTEIVTLTEGSDGGRGLLTEARGPLVGTWR